MRPISFFTLFLGFCLIPANAIAQNSSTHQRSQEIAASFSKEKHKVKEKNGVRSEKYKKVVCEPATRQDITAYSGVYEVTGLGYLINIEVKSDGNVIATGSEPGNGGTRSFRLEGARITGAMLTATKLYDDGVREKFEGLFMKRTEFNSPTDRGVSTFGLGVIGESIDLGGVTLDKAFYQLKQ
jgi:hypothetical protein